jgi:hypothetical protein
MRMKQQEDTLSVLESCFRSHGCLLFSVCAQEKQETTCRKKTHLILKSDITNYCFMYQLASFWCKRYNEIDVEKKNNYPILTFLLHLISSFWCKRYKNVGAG